MGRLVPWMIVVVSALAYPFVVLALAGAPAFPSRDSCVRPAMEDGEIDAVFGRFDSERAATSVRARALAAGFQGTEAAGDGCGRVRVFLSGIPTMEVGREFAEEARSVGFEITLEQAG